MGHKLTTKLFEYLALNGSKKEHLSPEEENSISLKLNEELREGTVVLTFRNQKSEYAIHHQILHLLRLQMVQTHAARSLQEARTYHLQSQQPDLSTPRQGKDLHHKKWHDRHLRGEDWPQERPQQPPQNNHLRSGKVSVRQLLWLLGRHLQQTQQNVRNRTRIHCSLLPQQG